MQIWHKLYSWENWIHFKVFVLCSLNRLVRLSQVHCSKLQRRVLLLLDLAQQPQWQSSIYQSSSVSARCTAETLSVLLTNNNNKSSCMSWDCRKTSINAQLWKETCLWFFFFFLKVMYRNHIQCLNNNNNTAANVCPWESCTTTWLEK